MPSKFLNDYSRPLVDAENVINSPITAEAHNAPRTGRHYGPNESGKFLFETGRPVRIKASGKVGLVETKQWHNDCEPSYRLEGFNVPFWQSQLETINFDCFTRAVERGWLIERIGAGIPLWLYLHNGVQWTSDSSQALRFARHMDGDLFRQHLNLEGNFVVTEHSWY